MGYSIQHTTVTGVRPSWYQLESARNLKAAARRALNYALDNGGYICVKDEQGAVVYGTDPAALDQAIARGVNRDFLPL